MKKRLLLCVGLWVFSTGLIFAQVDSVQAYNSFRDSVHAALKYQTGSVQLKDASGELLANLKVPTGFKYLDGKQSSYVLEKLWGNPATDGSLGMLFPATKGPLSDSSWAFNIQYDDMGYVKDDDADDIDYEELLTNMQKEISEANASRQEEGYEPITLVGWASKPYYDKEKHILHWAKEVKFGDAAVNTLNYNVRILGRKGVMVLNAIASMPELKEVNQHIGQVTGIVQFADGNRYADFDSGIDKVAAYGIGGLVAGKVLAKVGFFAIIAKFGKVIFVAIAAGASYVWKLVTGRRKDEEEQLPMPNDNQA